MAQCSTLKRSAISMPALPDLVHRLTELIAQIPRGRVTTCGRLADALGDVIAARWVGHYLLHHDHHPACHCHRVVRAGGQLGQYIGDPDSAVTGNTSRKASLLAEEGIDPCGEHVDLERFAFDEFDTDRPLARLRRWQERLADRISLHPPDSSPQTVAGVDVSYRPSDRAVASYVLFDLATGEQVWTHTTTCGAVFPYVSSYLAFRELPGLVQLIDEVRARDRLADVVMVDGSGVLHPRRAGSASCLGVVADVPTIGVTKKLLSGSVARRELDPGQSCDVIVGSQVVGVAIRCGARSKKPVYVSPGHGVDLALATRIVQQTAVGRRLPDPLHWADRLSRQVASSE